MIIIVDYGMGNLRSIQKALDYLGIPNKVSSNPMDLYSADKIILPGVGHFEKGMENLEKSKFTSALKEVVTNNRKPILGICLGMQLMTKFSEEGNVDGLGFIDAKTLKFPKSDLKIPHMGWNSVFVKKSTSLNFSFLETDLVYFVHSYYVKCNNKEDVVFETNYVLNFDSGFQKNNIVGFQFHPEKSHKRGVQLLQNFNQLENV
jgi:imidazole glycerol-phosphate synthase subunit HisH